MNAVDLLASPLLEGSPDWQMRYGERFALEGILASLKPHLAVEIGTAQGGSLRRIAAHAQEVHSFDIVPEIEALERELPNVTTHVGDSAELVPKLLSDLESKGREVDFALVDGDHTVAGVRRDAEALLASEACRQTAIVFHDAANDDVRDGLEGVRFEDHPKVAYVNLDFIAGYLVSDPIRHLEIWNGLAIVLLDADRGGPAARERGFFDSALVLRQARERARRRSQAVRAPSAAPTSAPAPQASSNGRRAPLLALGSGACMGLLAGLAAGRGRR